jgi:hypothetical protein
MNIWRKLRKRHILVEKAKESTEKSKLLKKIVMKSLLLRKITRERRIKRDMLKRLCVLKRNGEKMKTHYKSLQQKTTTYH